MCVFRVRSVEANTSRSGDCLRVCTFNTHIHAECPGCSTLVDDSTSAGLVAQTDHIFA